MAKKALVPLGEPPQKRRIVPPVKPPEPKKDASRQRVGFVALLVVGLIILIVASIFACGWMERFTSILGTTSSAAPSVTTLTVQRAAPYAGLDVTVLNAQLASSFPDDPIHSGAAVVRLNLQVTNPTSGQASILYYDAARLIVPNLAPIAPGNVTLATDPAPHTSQNGWIDFDVSRAVQLSTLKLQLGSLSQQESLVIIPFTGPFNPASYQDRTVHQSLAINYYFPYYQPNLLVYHLTAVEVRYDYEGSQVKAKQQFYILDFQVDNPNGFSVSPGYGYDYIRLIVKGSPLPPVDNTLPFGFKAGAHHVSGHVVFSAPAGMHSLTIDFLVQYGSGGSNYTVKM